MADASPSRGRRAAWFDPAYLAVCVVLFAYGLRQWRGMIGDGRPWQPTRFVALTSGMLLQAIAAVVRTRSVRLFWGLLVASLVALGFSLTLRS